eukprot:9951445-Heterocapsa_arctica.AAC.1
MALAQGRLVPHGKHTDLHRRALRAMEGRGSGGIRVKWVPSRKEEQGLLDGIISQEDMEGDRETDKLATKGVELHMVPEHQVAMVQAQDKLVEDLLNMLLSAMK